MEDLENTIEVTKAKFDAIQTMCNLDPILADNYNVDFCWQNLHKSVKERTYRSEYLDLERKERLGISIIQSKIGPEKIYYSFKIHYVDVNNSPKHTIFTTSFSELMEFRELLVENYSDFCIPILLEKNKSQMMLQNDDFIEERKIHMNTFLNKILSHDKLRSTIEVRTFCKIESESANNIAKSTFDFVMNFAQKKAKQYGDSFSMFINNCSISDENKAFFDRVQEQAEQIDKFILYIDASKQYYASVTSVLDCDYMIEGDSNLHGSSKKGYNLGKKILQFKDLVEAQREALTFAKQIKSDLDALIELLWRLEKKSFNLLKLQNQRKNSGTKAGELNSHDLKIRIQLAAFEHKKAEIYFSKESEHILRCSDENFNHFLKIYINSTKLT